MLCALLVKINVSSYLFATDKFSRVSQTFMSLFGFRPRFPVSIFIVKATSNWTKIRPKTSDKAGTKASGIHQAWYFGLNYCGFKAKTLSLNLNASWKGWRKKGFQPGPLSEVRIQGVTGTPFLRSWSGMAAGCWDQQWEAFCCCSQQWPWRGAEVPASFVVLFRGEVSLSNHMD